MSSTQKAGLKRSVNLPMLVFYGLGNIFGAGIYVLVGKMAGIAGMYVPFSFLVACIVVFFTALSYAELSARYPLSAGEAVYVNEGFQLSWLSTGVGLLIAISGLLSSATILHGFHGYLTTFITLPESITVFAVVAILTAVSIWGITESMVFALILTLAEIIGLLMVLTAGVGYIDVDSINISEMIPPFDFSIFNMIILGAFLAFYAFIGFEDMVNIAEEVKTPKKTMPRAIIITLAIATLFYIAVSVVSILVVSPGDLSASSAPLATVYETASGKSAGVLSMIAMVAVLNGALIQIIMVSRIFYGMSQQGWLPAFLGRVHPRTHTPIVATVVTGVLIYLFTVWFELLTLAQFTSFFIFIVFTLVNISLLLIKRKDPRPEGIRIYTKAVPITAIVLNLILLAFQIISVI